MAEEEDVSRGGPRSLDHAVDPSGHLVGGFAAGARVRPHRPTGDALADRRRRDPLVVAVGPLREVLVDLGGGVAGELSGAARPCARAR